ncbi:MAG: hypothetical protein ACT4NP_05700 [Pseudonocardiales bacterium]
MTRVGATLQLPTRTVAWLVRGATRLSASLGEITPRQVPDSGDKPDLIAWVGRTY